MLHNGGNARLVDSFSFTDDLRFESDVTPPHWQQACDADVRQSRGEPPPCAKHFPSYLVRRHGMSR